MSNLENQSDLSVNLIFNTKYFEASFNQRVTSVTGFSIQEVSFA